MNQSASVKNPEQMGKTTSIRQLLFCVFGRNNDSSGHLLRLKILQRQRLAKMLVLATPRRGRLGPFIKMISVRQGHLCPPRVFTA